MKMGLATMIILTRYLLPVQKIKQKLPFQHFTSISSLPFLDVSQVSNASLTILYKNRKNVKDNIFFNAFV